MILATACSNPLSQADIDAQLLAEADRIRAWTTDATLVAAIKAQNAQNLTLAVIQQRDTDWVAGNAAGAALVTAATTGACADRLRALAAASPRYGEEILMDNKGANVCVSAKTSDYWQGDEEKFTRSFGAGPNSTHIGAVQFDQSVGEREAQISITVSDAGVPIGALTVGIRVDRLKKP